jgi:glycosyltransferase involved in cell wall biosynthesis
VRRILWRCKSSWLRDSLRAARPVPGSRGGDAYNFHAARVLGERFALALDEEIIRRPGEGRLAHIWRVARRPWEADLAIQDPLVTAFGRRDGRGARVCILHHLDYALVRQSLRKRLYFRRVLRGLREVEYVVVVSAFWRRELEALGCRDVRVIHNAFDPDEYRFDAAELEDLRTRLDLPRDRPLVYVGNAQVEKGVTDAAAALRDEPYTLVTTGPRSPGLDLPGVLHFDLDHRDYVRLLAASDVVVTMSRMLEGWCRTAHEAMLCGTPVIGSGTGGMRELLEGGGQRLLAGAAALPEAARSVLARRDELGAQGRAFAARFDPAYFRAAWTGLVEEALN